MPSGNLGIVHIQKRKNINKKHQIFFLIKKVTNKIKYNIIENHESNIIRKLFLKLKFETKKTLDKTMYFVALIGPVMTLPQTIKIFESHDASSVSELTWITYIIAATLWLMYGIFHKEKPIIFSNILWLIAHSSVLIGIIIYG